MPFEQYAKRANHTDAPVSQLDQYPAASSRPGNILNKLLVKSTENICNRREIGQKDSQNSARGTKVPAIPQIVKGHISALSNKVN